MKKITLLVVGMLIVTFSIFATGIPLSITQFNIKNRVGNLLITFSSSNEYNVTSTVINTQNNKISGSATQKYPVVTQIKDGIATIETTLPDDLNLLDILTLSIPASSPLKIITATSEIGNISFANIIKNNVQIVLFSASMGDISIQNSSQASLKSLTVLNGMGKITIQNLPEKCSLKIEDDMGNVVLQNMPTNFELSLVEKIGDIFYLGDIGNLRATVKQGDVYLDGKNVSSNTYTNLNTGVLVPQKTIINEMGDIKLNTLTR